MKYKRAKRISNTWGLCAFRLPPSFNALNHFNLDGGAIDDACLIGVYVPDLRGACEKSFSTSRSSGIIVYYRLRRSAAPRPESSPVFRRVGTSTTIGLPSRAARHCLPEQNRPMAPGVYHLFALTNEWRRDLSSTNLAVLGCLARRW